MNKAHSNINWENYPSDKTPLNEENLNKMDSAIEVIDNRVITLDTNKATKTEVSTLVEDISFEESTGIITVTKKNGSKITIDTQMEKIAVNFSYDRITQQIILTLIDGTKQYIDISALITQYEFIDSDTISFLIDVNGEVSAIIKKGSISEECLDQNYLAKIKVEVAKAQSSATNAATSEANAKVSETNAATSEANAKKCLDEFDKRVGEKIDKTGDVSDTTVIFNTASDRANLTSREKLSISLGKIKKWLIDLKAVAFTGSYNDLEGVPETFVPSTHLHTKSEITDFPDALPANGGSAKTADAITGTVLFTGPSGGTNVELKKNTTIDLSGLFNLDNVIISGQQTVVSQEDGGINEYTFTDTSGKKSTIQVKNGSKGTQGDKGNTGATGQRGSRWTTGTAIIGTSTTATVFSATGITDALVNDMYLNTSTGNVYKCTVAGTASTAKWSYSGCIKGTKGDKGDSGATTGSSETATCLFSGAEDIVLTGQLSSDISSDKMNALKQARIIRLIFSPKADSNIGVANAVDIAPLSYNSPYSGASSGSGYYFITTVTNTGCDEVWILEGYLDDTSSSELFMQIYGTSLLYKSKVYTNITSLSEIPSDAQSDRPVLIGVYAIS